MQHSNHFCSCLRHMNVPQVYLWSIDMDPPLGDDRGLPTMDTFRFRTGVWFCGRGACRIDRQISVTIIFTRPTLVSEHIVTHLMFDYLWRDNKVDQPRADEAGLCWTFSRLYYLLTDCRWKSKPYSAWRKSLLLTLSSRP